MSSYPIAPLLPAIVLIGALAWAGLLLAIASSPLVYWASKPILRAAPKLRSGQLVVGDIPREPVALQAPPHLIDELRRTLEQTGTTAITAISGLSGTGKTQLAADYARQAIRDGWPIVVWVRATSERQLTAGLADLAAKVRVFSPGSDAARSALDWLVRQPHFVI